jgi:hypothetical protein
MLKNKKYIISFLMSFMSLLGYAQVGNIPDQNPRYGNSLKKYTVLTDSLLQSQGSTVQQTYKAYDWYEAKQERRALRRERRHQERMANPYYDWYPSVNLYSGWGYNNWGWGPSLNFSGRYWY